MTLRQPFPSSLPRTFSFIAIMYPIPHQRSISNSLVAVLRLLPPYPWRPGGPSGGGCFLCTRREILTYLWVRCKLEDRNRSRQERSSVNGKQNK